MAHSRNGVRHIGARLSVPTVAALVVCGPAAIAGSVELGNEYSLNTIATFTYSAAMRLDDPAGEIIANVNGDDGDRNFNRHALINNRIALLGEMDLRRRRSGLFVRGSIFYDDAYQGGNDNDSPDTVNKSGAYDEFSDAAEDRLGYRARLLDAYAYTGFSIGEVAVDLRAGRQVVSWGESLFFPNTSGAQAPADATKSNVPGTEVKDILLPTGQVYLQLGFTPSWSVSAYWQWEWEQTELTPADGYFSSSDLVGPGAEFLILQDLPLPPPLPSGYKVPRGPDIEPGDSGQWGISTKFILGDATEVSLQHLVYHDKAPGVITNTGTVTFDLEVAPGVVVPIPVDGLPASYQLYYADDIKLSSASVNSELFGAAIGAELSYREDASFLINAPSATPTRGDAWQANLNLTKLFLPTRWYDTLTVLGEVGWARIDEVEAIAVGDVEYDEVTNGREAYAYQLLAQLGYKQVFPGWDLTLSFVHANAFDGKPAIAGSFGSLTGEGDERYTFGPSFKYLQNLELALAYNGYHGSPGPEHPLADRSYLSFSAKYSF